MKRLLKVVNYCSSSIRYLARGSNKVQTSSTARAGEAMDLFRQPAATTFPVRGEGFCCDACQCHSNECESPHPVITPDGSFAWCHVRHSFGISSICLFSGGDKVLTSSASQARHLLQRRRHARKVWCASEFMDLIHRCAIPLPRARGRLFVYRKPLVRPGVR